ncbi:lysozyme inhibitor LprI family protein [Rhizobium sp. KVB221]|uniref:Lysozyme inhibitor LprI family protein n=1 Tax=Rhizobium setariae TaxID=2801340 RepID=A0A936YT39_9HYPH|nr:lysozyme inhibitor LprI family protein [Rhizobium setariae]MBL0372466.1 lysozyme inhibitor LprI family protein [Rhizobium setariae]
MKNIAFAFLVIASGASAALAQEDPPVDCANAQTQADMNQCSYQDFETADKELNAVYKQALASQAEVDKEAAEMGPDYVGAVKALKKAQRAWIDYRDGHCDGVGYEAVGGSMQPMLINGCMATLTQTRTKELKELVQGMGN